MKQKEYCLCIISRLDMVEEKKVSELEDTSTETSLTKNKTKKKKENKQKPEYLERDVTTKCNIYTMRIFKTKKKE